MVPFHLFLFSLFVKKTNKEMTTQDYQNSLFANKLRETSKDIRYTMKHFM
ncbi:hypothetical protein [Bacillus sp. AK128]